MNVEDAYRDLIWSAQSASLVREDLTACLFSNTELETLTSGNNVEAFHRFLTHREASMSHKVGLYFELLVEFLISDVLRGQIIHRGEQVIEDGRTIGEVDFIFQHDAAIWHLETAVKFYLFVPEACPIAERLVGPNSSDNFEAKMDSLFSQQLPLSGRFFPQVTERVAFVKGRIFYPHNSAEFNHGSSVAVDDSNRLSSGHERGVWCRAMDCHDFFGQLKTNRFVVRRKPHWLANVRKSPASKDLLTSSETVTLLLQHFKNSKRPLMLSSLAEVDGWFQEVDRFFVVDNHWPWQ